MDSHTHDQGLLFEDDTDSAAGRVVQAARTALRAHLATSSRKREAETVKRWQAEGVYPYKGERSRRWRRRRATPSTS